MKKILNKLSVWLYLKTRDNEIENVVSLFGSIKLIKSPHIPNNQCVIGSGTADSMRIYFLDEEIRANQPPQSKRDIYKTRK